MVSALEDNNDRENDFWVVWVEEEEVKGFIKCCPRRDGIFLVFLSRKPDVLELKEFSAYQLDRKRKVLLLANPGYSQTWAGKQFDAGLINQEGMLNGLVNELEIRRFSKPYSRAKYGHLTRWALVVTGRTCQCCGRPMLCSGSDLFGEEVVCEPCLFGLCQEDGEGPEGY